MSLLPDDLRDLFDDYLDGTIDAAGMTRLESSLRENEAFRAEFVRYGRLHTDIALQCRTERATEIALREILPAEPVRRPRRVWPALLATLATACAIVISVALFTRSPEPTTVAWVVNAQDCEWTDGRVPEDGLRPGTMVAVDRGLVEIRFRSGVRAVLEGPVRLELLTDNSARLHRGRVSANVPEPAIGFELLSPQGKVIDLGTEFGVSVDDTGKTDVVVYRGQVEAIPGTGEKLNLTDHQAATLQGGSAKRLDHAPDDIVRAIVPRTKTSPVVRTFDFRAPSVSSLKDRHGRGIGLTARLPGTGAALAERDANLTLVPERGLELTTTNSDINCQVNMPTGEYFGIKLADLGFTGSEDFEIVADFPDIPALRRVGQFGLFAGSSSTKNIRGGVISKDKGEYVQNIVNNNGGKDTDSVFVGLSATGDDMRMILRRKAGRYDLAVENRTRATTVTLATKQPAFLDNDADVHVGIFGANTRSNEPKTVVVREVRVTVWVPAR